MEKSYKSVEKVEEVQVPVYTFKASDLTDVEVTPYSANFIFEGEEVEITGAPSELLAVKALVDSAVRKAQGVY